MIGHYITLTVKDDDFDLSVEQWVKDVDKYYRQLPIYYDGQSDIHWMLLEWCYCLAPSLVLSLEPEVYVQFMKLAMTLYHAIWMYGVLPNEVCALHIAMMSPLVAWNKHLNLK